MRTRVFTESAWNQFVGCFRVIWQTKLSQSKRGQSFRPLTSCFLGAGDGNRTRLTSLEGSGSTNELRPQNTTIIVPQRWLLSEKSCLPRRICTISPPTSSANLRPTRPTCLAYPAYPVRLGGWFLCVLGSIPLCMGAAYGGGCLVCAWFVGEFVIEGHEC